MFEDKRCDVSLGLEPSLRAGSLYVCGIMGPGPLCLMANNMGSPWADVDGIIKVGRNALAFLGNAADRRRLRTAWSSVHGM